ncbi:hypothetical protein Tco_0823854 [Tanacetum coccineum]|uniref:Uncharacterized protein n=1 Tax=Tanacetum coccineum TaxID=301880 RepID=A0ABQ5AJ64_9ASTR
MANKNTATNAIPSLLWKSLDNNESCHGKEVADKLKTDKRKHDSDDDEDDDDDEGPSAGSNQGRSTKRRRSDSAASGSAKPPPKDDDQSSKKPRESEASHLLPYNIHSHLNWMQIHKHKRGLRKEFYINKHSESSDREAVRSQMRILSVISVKLVEIESYQTKINLERPNWDAADYYFKEDYTIVPKPRAVVYRDRNDQRKLMRLNELHKFSDGTLTRVMEKLDHMVKDFHLYEYNKGMETRKWSEDDKRRSKDFITAIEKRLQIRRIYRSLESFVGGRIRDIDYRLINRTTPHKGVKASANSDVMYSFTSAQDGDPLQDDVRLCLGDDLKKAQDHSDARDIWNAVKARFGGNAESKKMRKSMLKQEFLEFRISKAEGLYKGYDRMHKILSQLNQLKAKPEDKYINLKFLRALPSSWSQIALTLKTKGGLELLSFDDLYYKLKTLEVYIKGYSTFSLSQSAGPSHSTFVSTTSASKKMSYADSPSYTSSTYTVPSNSKIGSYRSGNVIEDVLQSFVADTELEQQLAYEDFDQIEKLDLEEM